MKVKLKNIKIELNTALKQEHVPDIERHIFVIKDRAMSCCLTLPFKHIPK